MPNFELDSAFSPTADQPAAVDALARGIEEGERFQTLLEDIESFQDIVIDDHDHDEDE